MSAAPPAPAQASGHDGGVEPAADRRVAISGFVDHHTHLLAAAAGTPFPWQGTTVRAFHEQVRRDGATPMDVPEPAIGESLQERARRLYQGLAIAAAGGLVEVTEMGMRHWWYLDALASLGETPLPARVRIYLASGLAEQSVSAEFGARRADCGPWVRLEGVKFYADGWLGPRTCAMWRKFDDEDSDGILFQDSSTLARRIGPFAATGSCRRTRCGCRPSTSTRSRFAAASQRRSAKPHAPRASRRPAARRWPCHSPRP